MKTALISFIVFSAFLNFSCRQNVESAPNAASEEVKKTSLPSPTPEKYQEIDIIEQVSAMGKENAPTLLEYDGYTVKKVSVKRKDDPDNSEADIYDLIISKNGQTIKRFAGNYNSLGNDMSFGLYSFLGNSEKQLFIVEESNRYDREWIVNLSPKYEVLFDAADFDVVSGNLKVLDIDNDGVKEIALDKLFDFGFVFPTKFYKWVRIIFKYDAVTHKYLPASHKFSDFTLKDQNEQIQKFQKDKSFTDVLEVFMTYIYAGKETEAWQFLDENLADKNLQFGSAENKVSAREKITAALKKDKIYQFIKADSLKGN